MIHLEVEEALALHAEIKGLSIDAARAELLHEDLLESALMRPRQAAHYADADLAQQAALLLCGIAETQPFIDGNKRTALVVALKWEVVIVSRGDGGAFQLIAEIVRTATSNSTTVLTGVVQPGQQIVTQMRISDDGRASFGPFQQMSRTRAKIVDVGSTTTAPLPQAVKSFAPPVERPDLCAAR